MLRLNVRALPASWIKTKASVAAAVNADGRLFLGAHAALNQNGEVVGPDDAAAQASAALHAVERTLSSAGGSLADIARLTIYVVDPAHGEPVRREISRRLSGASPAIRTVVTAGLPLSQMLVQLDAEAVLRREQSGGEDIFVPSADPPDPSESHDPSVQADGVLSHLRASLQAAGSGMDDVCKITVYISDRAHRSAVYPVIGKYFRGIHPVSTGIIVPAFARPGTLVDIDAQIVRKHRGQPHTRLRKYHSNAARYGTQQQPLDCDFCMAVCAGRRVILRGQTGVDLDEVFRGRGDAVAQARQAMENAAILLAEAGARLSDVTRVTVFVTDRAFLAGVSAAILDRLEGATPAFTALVVKGLASPELLMEVDITAVIPGEGS